jgi:phosphatidylglycerophosphate synthase
MIRLTEIIQKRKKKYQESYLFDFTRMCSLPFTWLFSNTPLTPNMISLLSFVLTLFACGFIITGDTWNILMGGIICWLSWVFDCVDGEVARVKKMGNDFGAWFDGVFDRVGDVLLFAAITVALFIQTPTMLSVLVGALATASTTLWRLNTLYTKTTFKLPLTSKNPLKRFGFDTAFMYFIISLGLIFNGYWLGFSYGVWSIQVSVLFIVMLFFAVVLNAVTFKNIVTTYYKHRPKKPAVKA